MHAPTAGFSAARTKEVTVGELDGLVLDGTENVFRECAGFGPGLAAVRRCHQHSPPGAGTWADFVEEQQRTALWLEKDWVPAWIPLGGRFNAVRDLYRRGPLAIQL